MFILGVPVSKTGKDWRIISENDITTLRNSAVKLLHTKAPPLTHHPPEKLLHQFRLIGTVIFHPFGAQVIGLEQGDDLNNLSL